MLIIIVFHEDSESGLRMVDFLRDRVEIMISGYVSINSFHFSVGINNKCC